MTKDHESSFSESDGRTKLLRSRPEPDNIPVFGIATLIGLFFSFMAFLFVISEMIEIGWQGLDGFGPFLKLFIQAFIICGIPIAYTLMVSGNNRDRSIPIQTNDMGCCWDLGSCSTQQESLPCQAGVNKKR